MTQLRTTGEKTARLTRDFIAGYDPTNVADRNLVAWIRERLHSELYRRERDRYPEWVDLGGES